MIITFVGIYYVASVLNCNPCYSRWNLTLTSSLANTSKRLMFPINTSPVKTFPLARRLFPFSRNRRSTFEQLVSNLLSMQNQVLYHRFHLSLEDHNFPVEKMHWKGVWLKRCKSVFIQTNRRRWLLYFFIYLQHLLKMVLSKNAGNREKPGPIYAWHPRSADKFI